MKRTALIVLLLLAAAAARGQGAEAALNFCGLSIPVVAGCTPEAGCVLRCDKYELKWSYLDYRQMAAAADVVAKTERKRYKESEQAPLEGFILDAPAKGHRLSYLTDAGMVYQLIFCGVAKGQPVLVQLTMDVDPEKTADLPEVARRIMRLTK